MSASKKSPFSPDLKLLIAMLPALLIPIAGTILTEAPLLWPVSALMFNLGLWCCFALVPHRAVRLIAYNLVAAFFFVIEASFFFSFYLQNAGFNEAFFYHLRPDLLHAGVREYLPVLLLMAACLTGFLAMASTALARAETRKSLPVPVVLGLLAFGLLLSPSTRALVLHAAHSTAGNAGDARFENFRELLGPKVAVEFSKPQKPNVVLIYAESLEQGYFDEAVFPGLLPNLKRLRAQSLDFSNVSQGEGAGWTIAGIVASQCAYPLASSHEVDGNDLGIFDKFLPKATCLGDLLEADGYHLTFIGGADARFAGKSNFLDSHGYQEVIDDDVLQTSLADKSYLNSWGAFDDTLFDYAIDKFRTMSSKETPFLLTLLTLDAHGPVGNLSKSCGVYRAGDNSNLNSFHCSDQLISKFIEQIRNSTYSKNTIIIVLSDHLALRNQATPLLEASQMPSRLTFFINTPDGIAKKNTNPGVHYDIAPTILDLIGYKISGQMGFGASLNQGPGYLPHKFGEDNWKQQSANLMAIGRTLWDNDVTLDGGGIKFNASNLTLDLGGREFILRSKGISSDAPATTLLFFDDQSLRLEKIEVYPFDQGLTQQALGKKLLQYKTKLVLVITRAGNLPGAYDQRNDPNRWVYFFGKPGSIEFSWGEIARGFSIPFEKIRGLSHSKMDDRVIQAREILLKAAESHGTTL